MEKLPSYIDLLNKDGNAEIMFFESQKTPGFCPHEILLMNLFLYYSLIKKKKCKFYSLLTVENYHFQDLLHKLLPTYQNLAPDKYASKIMDKIDLNIHTIDYWGEIDPNGTDIIFLANYLDPNKGIKGLKELRLEAIKKSRSSIVVGAPSGRSRNAYDYFRHELMISTNWYQNRFTKTKEQIITNCLKDRINGNGEEIFINVDKDDFVFGDLHFEPLISSGPSEDSISKKIKSIF